MDPICAKNRHFNFSLLTFREKKEEEEEWDDDEEKEDEDAGVENLNPAWGGTLSHIWLLLA